MANDKVPDGIMKCLIDAFDKDIVDKKSSNPVIYPLSIEFIVHMKEGTGTVLKVEDVANALRQQGHIVHFITNPLNEPKARLLVYPPRHIVTGEDIKLELQEKENP